MVELQSAAQFFDTRILKLINLILSSVQGVFLVLPHVAFARRRLWFAR